MASMRARIVINSRSRCRSNGTAARSQSTPASNFRLDKLPAAKSIPSRTIITNIRLPTSCSACTTALNRQGAFVKMDPNQLRQNAMKMMETMRRQGGGGGGPGKAGFGALGGLVLLGSGVYVANNALFNGERFWLLC